MSRLWFYVAWIQLTTGTRVSPQISHRFLIVDTPTVAIMKRPTHLQLTVNPNPKPVNANQKYHQNWKGLWMHVWVIWWYQLVNQGIPGLLIVKIDPDKRCSCSKWQEHRIQQDMSIIGDQTILYDMPSVFPWLFIAHFLILTIAYHQGSYHGRCHWMTRLSHSPISDRYSQYTIQSTKHTHRYIWNSWTKIIPNVSMSV